jgi:uncharacterized membrane protein YgdD (TMEM256/DUF423 family)
MHSKRFIVLGGILGAIGVALGAFGSHGLNDILTQNARLDTFDTASQYHLIHALGLLIIGLLAERTPSRYLTWAGYAMVAGVIIFSGSLYILAVFNLRFMGAIAPIGGTAFILSWGLIAFAALKHAD